MRAVDTKSESSALTGASTTVAILVYSWVIDTDSKTIYHGMARKSTRLLSVNRKWESRASKLGAVEGGMHSVYARFHQSVKIVDQFMNIIPQKLLYPSAIIWTKKLDKHVPRNYLLENCRELEENEGCRWKLGGRNQVAILTPHWKSRINCGNIYTCPPRHDALVMRHASSCQFVATTTMSLPPEVQKLVEGKIVIILLLRLYTCLDLGHFIGL